MTVSERIVEALIGPGGFFTVRAGLTFLFSCATVFLWITGEPVPDELLAINSLIVGAYFASRISETSTAAAATVQANKVEAAAEVAADKAAGGF